MAPKNFRKGVIGIVGGMGPYAGLDLVRKVFDQTKASRDQDHINLVMVSFPKEIEDRTEFLIGRSQKNPARSIANVVLQLEKLGATVAGIPCNTAHAPLIFNKITQRLRKARCRTKLLNLIEETASYVGSMRAKPRRIGVLSTTGSMKTGLYSNALKEYGLDIVELDENSQANLVQEAIYNSSYGIKSQSNPVTDRARQLVMEALQLLKENGADVIILGCTELPLAVDQLEFAGLPLVDPAVIFARSLIRHIDESKLKPTS